MMRRRGVGRRGVVGTMATTAVVAGTATAVSGRVSAARRAGSSRPRMPRRTSSSRPPTVYAEPAVSAGLQPDQIEQLTQLAQLKDQGVLTEEEFAEQKARILGS